MPLRLTLGIVSKNRPDKLARLISVIASWKSSSEYIDQIIVVDNSDKLNKIHKFGLPLVYYHKYFSVPQARNFILNKTQTKWLGFLDDDCEPANDWIEQASLAMEHYPKAAYLVGNNLLKNPEFYWAQVQYHRHMYWQKKQLIGANQTIGFHLDTKNCLLNIYFLRQHKLFFDEKLHIGGYDNADTDLGFAVERIGGKGYWIEKMRIFHPEVTNFFAVRKKAKLRGKLSGLLADKWKITQEFVAFVPLLSIGYFKAYYLNYYKDFCQYLKQHSTQRRVLFVFVGILIYDHWYKSGYVRSRSKII